MSAAFRAAAKTGWRPSRLNPDFSRNDNTTSPSFRAAPNMSLRPSRTRRARIALRATQLAEDKARKQSHEADHAIAGFGFFMLAVFGIYQLGSKRSLKQHLNERKKEAADLRQAMEDLRAEMSVETGWFWRARRIVEDPEIEPVKFIFPIKDYSAKGVTYREQLSRSFWRRPDDKADDYEGLLWLLGCCLVLSGLADLTPAAT